MPGLRLRGLYYIFPVLHARIGPWESCVVASGPTYQDWGPMPLQPHRPGLGPCIHSAWLCMWGLGFQGPAHPSSGPTFQDQGLGALNPLCQALYMVIVPLGPHSAFAQPHVLRWNSRLPCVPDDMVPGAGSGLWAEAWSPLLLTTVTLPCLVAVYPRKYQR